MKTKERHIGEIKTYKDLRHMGVLPPELIQRKLERGEALRRGDVRIGAENYEILQKLLDWGGRWWLRFPTLDGGNDVEISSYNGFVTEKKAVREGSVFTATDAEYEEMKKNGSGESRVCLPYTSSDSSPIDKARLKYLQDAVRAALDDVLNDRGIFENRKKQLLDVVKPELREGVEGLCRQEMKRQRRLKIIDDDVKVQRVKWSSPCVDFETRIILPSDVSFHLDRELRFILENAIDEGALRKPFKEMFDLDMGLCREKNFRLEGGNRLVTRWLFEKKT